MPHAARGAHPFNAARLDDAFRARGLFIGDPPLEKKRKRCNAGMRMKTDRRHVLRIDVVIIQEHERLDQLDRKSTRLNSSHLVISYAVFCFKKKKRRQIELTTSPAP